MSTEDDSPEQEPESPIAAAAAVGAAGEHPSHWAREGRARIQGSHCLTEPLARWAPELVEREGTAAEILPDGEAQTEIVIPEAVLHARPPQRLPEDSVCRSPIAGLVVAVMVSAGQRVVRHQPLLVIEAMKMQNQVSPDVDGVVKAVRVVAGEAVKAGQVLFELI